MEIRTELIDELLKDYQKPEDIIGENGLLKRFVKAVLERAMNAELTHHLGYEKHDPAGYNSGNSRNGTSGKTLKTEIGDVPDPRAAGSQWQLRAAVGEEAPDGRDPKKGSL